MEYIYTKMYNRLYKFNAYNVYIYIYSKNDLFQKN